MELHMEKLVHVSKIIVIIIIIINNFKVMLSHFPILQFLDYLLVMEFLFPILTTSATCTPGIFIIYKIIQKIIIIISMSKLLFILLF